MNFPFYNRDINSIRGYGKIVTDHTKSVCSKTFELNDSFPKYKDKKPFTNITISEKPQITSGYLYPIKNSRKMSDNYYPTQQLVKSYEPRYKDVIYPQRAYTYMYPYMPNTDDYYIDNINASKPSPIIIPDKIENFTNMSCYQNYNIIYYIIIALLITIYFYKNAK